MYVYGTYHADVAIHNFPKNADRIQENSYAVMIWKVQGFQESYETEAPDIRYTYLAFDIRSSEWMGQSCHDEKCHQSPVCVCRYAIA
jgi:hypothetical protein